jgi:hypothetical protein
MYKQFIFCYVYVRRVRVDLLLDIPNGKFSGKLFIPRDDVCYQYLVRSDVGIHVGFKNKTLIICKLRGDYRATIYDLAESIENGSLQILLKNGISISLKSRSEAISGDVYNLKILRDRMYVVTYQRQNVYKPRDYLFKLLSELHQIRRVNIMVNIWFDQLYIIGVPGPHAVALSKIHDPMNGLVRTGSGQNTFREIRTHFHPQINHINTNLDDQIKHFRFNPVDGSMLYLIPSSEKGARKSHILYIDVYKREM